MDGFDFEVFARCDHDDFVLIACGFSHEHFEELRTFIPPVAVELCVVGCGDVGRCAEYFLEVAALRLSVEEEVTGVFGGAVSSPAGDIGFLAVKGEFSGDAVELESSIAADSVGVEVGLDFGVWEVVAEVAVEFAVIGVAGVADFGAPYLAGTLEVTREGSDAAGGDHGAEGAIACRRI